MAWLNLIQVVCVCVRACVRACMRVCVCVHARASVHVYSGKGEQLCRCLYYGVCPVAILPNNSLHINIVINGLCKQYEPRSK